jgi:hypothetical protein
MYFLNKAISLNSIRNLIIIPLFFFLINQSINIPLLAKDNSSEIPMFSMKNQFNKSISNKDLINKNSIIMGCLPEDWKLCKTLARKIYWLMQNHIYGKEDSFQIIAFLSTDGLSIPKMNQLKFLLESDQIEPLYFDTKGELKVGLKRNSMLLKTFDAKGKTIRNENVIEIDKDSVNKIYNEFTIHLEKDSK